MSFIDESLAKGISKRIVREILDEFVTNREKSEFPDLMEMAPKKRARELIRICKKSNRFVFLEDRYREKTRWEVMWGEWSLGYRGNTPPETDDQYDRLYFDLTYSRKQSMHFKFFYIVLSKHALIRMIMRSGKDITSPPDAYKFIASLTRDAVLAGLSLLEGNDGHILYTKGFYLPLVIEEAFNLHGKKAISVVIKTVMPQHFEVKSSDVIDRSNYKKSYFDAADCFMDLN